MENECRLMVYMLGGFEMYYAGAPLHFGKKLTAKPLQLLQFLLYHREEGAARESVIEALFGQRDEIDAANNLNATVSQLRRLLRGTHLPEGNYIHIKLNRYYFEAPVETWVDIEEVRALRHEADLCEGTQRMEYLSRLCELYRERFLPELDGEIWAEIAKAYYQRMYRDSLTELCRGLRDRRAYDEILRLTGFAAKLFPYDEWQVWQQEALLAQGKFREAQDLYQQVEKLYLEGMNAPPPEEMRRRYRQPEQKFWRRTESADNVRRWLASEKVGEANGVPLPAFIFVYNLVSRMAGPENPFCLTICTLRQTDQRFTKDSADQSRLMDVLNQTLTGTLRLEDVYTRYSANQYLILLTGAREENLNVITERVRAGFSKASPGSGCSLDFQLVSANEISPVLDGVN